MEPDEKSNGVIRINNFDFPKVVRQVELTEECIDKIADAVVRIIREERKRTSTKEQEEEDAQLALIEKAKLRDKCGKCKHWTEHCRGRGKCDYKPNALTAMCYVCERFEKKGEDEE